MASLHSGDSGDPEQSPPTAMGSSDHAAFEPPHKVTEHKAMASAGRTAVKKEQKRRPKPRDGTQLFCGVCGDKALGYNFDAITCESCKAFFRRNANKRKTFSCVSDGKCQMDVHTRKFCSSCRLKKCFVIGMRKDWILNDAQLARRRSRLRVTSASSGSSISEQGSPGNSRQVNSNCHDTDDSRSSLEALSLPDSTQVQVDEENYSLPLREDIQESLTMMHQTYRDIFDATYTVEQSRKLQENPSSSSDLFNMTDIFIRRLVKFAKCIPEFKALNQEDQIHLLKGGIMEMFVLRSAMSFDLQKGSWKYSAQLQGGSVKEGKLEAQSLRSTLGSTMYMDHIDFLSSIHKLTRGDRTILMLLFVIDLMSADRPNLRDKHLVSQAQEKFSTWLQAYLQSSFTVGEAKYIYPKLLMKLLDVRNLGEASSKLAASLDIQRLEPLLVEMFDLK